MLAEDGTIAGESGMDDDDLTTAAHIREQSMIDQESSFEVQVSQCSRSSHHEVAGIALLLINFYIQDASQLAFNRTPAEYVTLAG